MDGCPQGGARSYGMSVGRPTLVGMMPLGTRVVPVDTTLESRIAARLNEVLDRMVAGDTYGFDPDDRGLAAPAPGSGCVHLRLSVRDVARLAAQEARAWF
jgi:hypothetical protein